MFMTWLAVLLLYGLFCGFGQIHPLCWWLLLPFWFQDESDSGVRQSLGDAWRELKRRP